MIVFNADIGSSDANSYVDVSSASDFILRYGKIEELTSWTALSAATQESLLIQATAYIDNSFTFTGEITNSSQALSWPRTNAVKNNTNYYEQNEIPVPIKIATSLLAIELKTSNKDTSSAYSPVKSIGVGDVSLTFRDTGENILGEELISPRVHSYLRVLGTKVFNTTSNPTTKIYRWSR